MRKRDRALILIESREHLQKNLLGQILFRDAARQVGANDSDNRRVKMINQGPGCRLVATADAIEAASQIEWRGVGFGHVEMEPIGGTATKTPAMTVELQWRRHRDRSLTFLTSGQ